MNCKNTLSIKDNKFLYGKNIVVTGCTGYIGSALLRILLNESCNLTLLCRNRGDIFFENYDHIKVVVGDLLDKKVWKDLLIGADYVFHLAGLEYDPTNFNHDLDLQLNFLSIVNLLQECDKSSLSPKIIFTSSSNIAKNKFSGRVSELDQDDPMSIWSLHKQIAENYLNYYSKCRDFKTVCLRFSNIYGPSGNLKTFLGSSINKMIMNGIEKNEISLYSNSQSSRDFLYVEDAAMALFLAAKFIDKLQEESYYYVGSDIGCSYYNAYITVKKSIKKILGIEVLEKKQMKKMGPFEMRNFVTDSSKFRSITGFQPQMPFQQGIEKTILSSLKLRNINEK